VPNVLGDTKTGYSDEWYTPAPILDEARRVLGSIDLDPASSALANEIVRATRIFTKDTDGLAKSWDEFGLATRLWLNPPYSNVAQWARKLAEEYHAGRVGAAILLVNACTETAWFQPLFQYPICFLPGRVQFVNPATDQNNPTIGSAAVYFGSRPSRFLERFMTLGAVVARLRDPCAHEGQRERRVDGLYCLACHRRIAL
jgi:ParB family chromosome partitioning protein